MLQLKKRRIVLLLGVLLFATAGVLFSFYYYGAFQRRAVACRINFGDPFGKRDDPSLVIDDPGQIEELVLKPMRLARPDLTPADYMAFAVLVLEYEDGTEDYYWLFIPFGYYKSGESYYVANFTKLKEEIRRRLQGKKGMERELKVLDYRP
jgi:hypothetical protein